MELKLIYIYVSNFLLKNHERIKNHNYLRKKEIIKLSKKANKRNTRSKKVRSMN